MHSLCLLLFAFKRLEVVEATLSRNLALELLEPVKGHSRSIGPEENTVIIDILRRGALHTHKFQISRQFAVDNRLPCAGWTLQLGEGPQMVL